MTECSREKLIGILPAAGRASRLSPLPCSKEVFPIGFYQAGDSKRSKVVAQYLLEQMREAGISKAMLVLGEGKWDIPAYFNNGSALGMELLYSVLPQSKGTPFTVDTVYPFVKDHVVALGFPDILLGEGNVFQPLLDKLEKTHCDILLGLFPADQPHLTDMVGLNEYGLVEYLDIKPQATDLALTWGVAVWTPVFSQFMHDWLAQVDFDKLHELGARHQHGELFLGDVIQAALESGLCVEALQVSDKPYLDIGTPDNLQLALQQFNKSE